MGASYRAGVKEHAYSAVFPIVHELCVAGATPVVHDPLHTDEELVGLGLIPYHVGDPVDAVIVHTDHAEYADLAAEHFPGMRALIDGRYITRPELWPGVQREVVSRITTRGITAAATSPMRRLFLRFRSSSAYWPDRLPCGLASDVSAAPRAIPDVIVEESHRLSLP